ncbi:hypothetical protein [Pseudomonas juntendi]|uniref:hypothetical protein n=1 Tax=Pseudomonas juntendi TaxID=2666183 RepID=UPI001F329525|nr:hypothetical protein [Pseudomonas juntendi]
MGDIQPRDAHLMRNPRALTVSLEAESVEHLRKLLELALFDLDKVIEKSGDREEGESVPIAMAGDMGSYKIVYKLGSHAAVDAHAGLLEQGYERRESARWTGRGYNVYRHAEQAAVRLYIDDGRITEHDEAEHEANIFAF